MHLSQLRPLALGLAASLALALQAWSRSAGQDAPSSQAQDQDEELERVLALERAEALHALRRGDLRSGRRLLDEHLSEDAGDAASRELRARLRARAADWTGALADAQRAWDDARGADPRLRADCARTLAEVLVELGRGAEALAALDAAGALADPAEDPRNAWVRARALAETGGSAERAQVLRAGLESRAAHTWERALAAARCARALGFLTRASRMVAEAERLPGEAGEDGAGQPDLLAELASIYFEADGEVEHPEAAARSPADLYKAALEASPAHEQASLGMHELHLVNWTRQQRSARDFLDDLFAAAPDNLAGLVRAARVDLTDGDLPAARARLARLEALAGGRRDVRTLQAALSWIEHRRDDCGAILERLATEDPADATPWVVIGRTLNDLYRFAEALEFLRLASERDGRDREAWTQLGRSLANTGATAEGLAALERATEVAEGRKDVWRHNTQLVLERMGRRFVTERFAGDLSFSWAPDGAAVLAAYQVPFYQAARAELAERYAFTPGHVDVQVFDRFQDFSVRSTGFEGFPALGVCFGPVVTAVSPISELRGKFSWARTGFHEFTHVVHLGLSHNRCPRWITEGLATWEEEQRNPAWTRNMRRELLDARANDELIAVRDLNGAFRGPRILFGYYQGGLLCRMLIDEHGFPPIIRLLQAFDRGLDLDRAFEEVYGATPEEIDARFDTFVARELAGVALEPRWGPGAVARLRLGLSEKPPADAAALEEWRSAWCTVAWGRWQSARVVDSEQALRALDAAGELPARAHFLRGEMALARDERAAARAAYEAGLAAGGADFRASMALARMAFDDGEWERAETHLLAAESQFPGFPEKSLAAELLLAEVYGRTQREPEMMAARERWLVWNSDEHALRLSSARWHAQGGRHEQAARWYEEVNEIDPMSRALHEGWGRSLLELARHEEALREFQVALLVPPELDLDGAGAAGDEERARLLGLQARALAGLARAEEARSAAEEALALDEDCPEARQALDALPW
jgi:predicted Zn-dependent protease